MVVPVGMECMDGATHHVIRQHHALCADGPLPLLAGWSSHDVPPLGHQAMIFGCLMLAVPISLSQPVSQGGGGGHTVAPAELSQSRCIPQKLKWRRSARKCTPR